MTTMAFFNLGPWEVLLILMVFGAPLWVLPIVLGVQCAQRKNYSPLWMLFGFTCPGAWIAYLVLATLPPRTPCPPCGGFIAAHLKICPRCQAPMPSPPTPPPLPPRSA